LDKELAIAREARAGEELRQAGLELAKFLGVELVD
jgi:hypothetical protein